MLLRQNKNLFKKKKKISPIALFSKEWKPNKKKESLHDEGSVFSYQKPP